MNKKELYKCYSSLEKLLSSEGIPNIIKAIEVFSPLTNKLKTNAKYLLDNTTQGMSERVSFTEEIQRVIEKEKMLKYRKIIIEVSLLQDKFNEIRSFLELNKEDDFISDIEEKMDTFLNYYEKHTRSYSISSCLSLSLITQELESVFKTTNQIINTTLLINLSNESKNDLTHIELYLSNVKTLKNFALKLNALANIYNEIVVLYGEQESEKPIIIEHLENGSLWIKVAGHSLTSILLTSVLASATNYYHNNFTQTGKMSNLPVAVDVANKLLRITEKLEEDGIDTSKIKENIESATRKISKELDTLLADQPFVEINDSKFDIGNSLSSKLIEQNKIKQIENKKESE